MVMPQVPPTVFTLFQQALPDLLEGAGTVVLHLWEAKRGWPHHLHGLGGEETVVGWQGQHSHPHPIADRLSGDGVPWGEGRGGQDNITTYF